MSFVWGVGEGRDRDGGGEKHGVSRFLEEGGGVEARGGPAAHEVYKGLRRRWHGVNKAVRHTWRCEYRKEGICSLGEWRSECGMRR